MSNRQIVSAPPDRDLPDGFHWEAAEEDDDWRLVQLPRSKRCRAGASRHTKGCRVPAVAEFNRRYRRWAGSWGETRVRDSWWAYCSEHMYGRWIEDGRIMHWRMVRDGE